jgi:hypothetical protein
MPYNGEFHFTALRLHRRVAVRLRDLRVAA